MNSDEIREQQVRQAVTEQAAAWYVRHRSGELSRTQKDAFLDWLRCSQLHIREYMAIAAARRDLRAALSRLQVTDEELIRRAWEEPRANVVSLAPEIKRTHHDSERLRTWNQRLALAGVAAMLLITSLYLVFGSKDSSRISLPRGEQRTVVLQDGSVLHVNTDSQVQVRYSDNERLIELEKGQLLIEVAHDRSRPLRVQAGDTNVVAVGTQFDVYRDPSRAVIVTVLQGKVEVKREGFTAQPLQLAAGQQVNLKETPTPPSVRPVDTHAATAWVRREIVFERRPLIEVAEEFNRYIPVPMQIADDALRERLVSGVFNAYDTESFLTYLERYGAEVEEGNDAILIRRRATSDSEVPVSASPRGSDAGNDPGEIIP